MDGNTPDSQTEADAIPPFAPRDPEAFTRNMAHVIEHLGKAAAAWVEPRERGETVDEGPVSARQLVSALSKLGDYWVSDPSRLIEAQTRLMTGYLDIWSNAVKRLGGEIQPDVASSAAADKRFAHPEWRENILYDVLRQVYLTTSDWADELVEKADELDPHTRHKAAFYVRQISHALSPSNFLLTNPELYRETLESNGANLVRGMKMFAEDMAEGRGQLRMRHSDASRFAVGRDMATTPGKVVAQNAVCQIIQYTPTTETVLARPLLICPPWINKFYILDLNAQKSFIRWAVAQGHTVFVISWVNPDESHAAKDWRDYIHDGILFGLDTAETATGERGANLVGYCVGGTLLAAAVAYLAAKGDDRIRSATLLTTQVDFTHAGDLKVFVDEEQLDQLANSMKAKGYLEGSRMATAFNMLRAGDMIWPYFVNNYLKGKEPMAFDLLYWNADSTRMPRANHLFYLRNCYLENRLATGTMEIDGVRLDLSKVEIPIYNLATKEDHIAPALSVYTGSLLLGPNVTFVVTGSGHIAGVVNPPGKPKYQYWTNGAPTADVGYADWLAHAAETPGSWWPHWQSWVEPLSGERVPAREPGGGRLDAIEDAPGSYVLVKS